MKILKFLHEHIFTIATNVLLVVLAVILFNVMKDVYNDNKNPPELRQYKGGIQNHLVWSVRGECYFVRPHNDYTVYLIRTEDCDKR